MTTALVLAGRASLRGAASPRQANGDTRMSVRVRLLFLVVLALLALAAGFAITAPDAAAAGCRWVFEGGRWLYLCS